MDGLDNNGSLSEIDRAIIGVLNRNCRLPVTRVGEELGIAPGKVATRIQSMLDNELIKFTAQRNLKAYGYDTYAILDITLSGKHPERAIAAICALQNAIIVAEALGSPQIFVFLVAKSQHELTQTIAVDIANIESIRTCQIHTVPEVLRFSGQVGALEPHTGFWSPGNSDDLDEIIIDKLQIDARISNSEISRQLGVSEASVRQRIAKMVAERRVRMGLLVEQRFLTVNNVRIDVAVSPSKVRTVIQKMGRFAPWLVLVSGQYQINATLQGANIENLSRIIHEEIESISGVQEVKTQLLIKHLKHNYNCIILPDA